MYTMSATPVVVDYCLFKTREHNTIVKLYTYIYVYTIIYKEKL